MKIKLNPGNCVRYYSKFSNCNLCEDICSTDVIQTKENLVEIYQDKCIGCGACIGVCPTEAIELNGFNITQFFFEFIKSEDSLISCKKNFVCLAALNIEYLISLALVKDFTLDLAHCESCELKESCYKKIIDNINEANYVLSSISDKEVKFEKLGVEKENESNRRDFLNIFTLKGAIKLKSEIEEDIKSLENPEVELPTKLIKAIKEKNIPNKRKLLFTILKKITPAKEYKYLENEHLTFISDKNIDNSCDNCSICYRICPTGALSSNRKNSTIFFDSMLCVRCHLCHDVCEKDSIKLSKFFDTKEFFEPEVKKLIEFNVIRCEDCGNFFTYFGEEEILCPRCRIEEIEAKDLWGIE